METLWEQTGWTLPSADMSVRVIARLATAALLGAIVGFEREWRGRAAGMRTQSMVALGSALFVLVPLEMGANSADLSQMVKGIAAGVGFLGAGAILKLVPEREIKGLTTASTIWVTAAVGMAAGAGMAWLAVATVMISLLALVVLGKAEINSDGKNH